MSSDSNNKTELSEALSSLNIGGDDELNNNDINTVAICANCGKEVVGNPNICNKCKAATYCNAACKKKHRHKHKEACEKRVAELQEEEIQCKRRAAELHDDKFSNYFLGSCWH